MLEEGVKVYVHVVRTSLATSESRLHQIPAVTHRHPDTYIRSECLTSSIMLQRNLAYRGQLNESEGLRAKGNRIVMWKEILNLIHQGHECPAPAKQTL